MAEWVIERLRASHERGNFSCGQASLDNFLATLVSQYEKRGLGRTFVATLPGQAQVAGFYTLAAGSLDLRCLPEAVRRKLPKHPIPTIHMGRLAVNQSFQGRRLGETLLFHALQQALNLSESLGAYAVDLWAIDASAHKFYEKYGFQSLADNSEHLFLPMQTVNGMFKP